MDEPRTGQRVELRSAPDRTGKCRSCQAPVQWAKTQRGASIPIDLGAPIETGASSFFVPSEFVHFATCPNAGQHRKRTTKKPTADRVQRLERTVDSLRAELAESAPRNAVKWADDRMREMAQRLRQTVSELRRAADELTRETTVRGGAPLTSQPGNVSGDRVNEIAENLDEWLLEFNTRGVRPYANSGRLAGD